MPPARHRRHRDVVHPWTATAVADPHRPASGWWAVVMLGLGYAGYIKGIPILSRFPIDLTATFAALCALGIALHLVRRYQFDARAVTAVVGLWSVFGIGAAMTIGADTGGGKAAILGSVTLVCALAPCYLLAGEPAQRWWLMSMVVAGLALVAATVVMPDTVARDVYGRFNVLGTSTIGTGRVIGAGILVAAVFALTRTGRRWMWWAIALVSSVALMANGSRGPLFALLIALVVVILVAKVFAGRRWATVAIFGVISGILAVLYSSSPSAIRSVLFVTGERADPVRDFLYREAWTGILHNPLGLGWGGFSAVPSIQFVYGGRAVYPHNMMLEAMVEGGWPAGLFLVTLAYFSMRGYIRASDTPQRAALFGLGVYWFAVAQTSSDVNGNRMTWITLIVGLMMAARVRQHQAGSGADVPRTDPGDRPASGTRRDDPPLLKEHEWTRHASSAAR